MKVYDASAWVAAYASLSGALPLAGGTMTGNIDMGNHSLIFGDFRMQRQGNNLIFKHNNNLRY